MKPTWQQLRLALFASTTLLMAACSSDSDNESANGSCHDLALDHCFLPYPSDDWSVADVSSETGIRLSVPSDIISSSLMKQLPSSITPEGLFNSSTGYSAGTAVLFEFPEPIDSTSLPENGGTAVVAIDLDSNETLPITAVVSAYSESEFVKHPAHLIEVYPRARWQFGHRYLVVVTNTLKPDYRGYEAFSGSAHMNEKALKYAEKKGLLAAVQGAGIDTTTVLSLTSFTVRSEEDATGRMKAATAAVYAEEHPIRKVRVIYDGLDDEDHIGATIQGQVRVNSFRNKEDGRMDWSLLESSDGLPESTQEWIKFVLVMPEAAENGPVPVSLYGHGIVAWQETARILGIAENNASLGIATLSIDQPNHGSRSDDDGGYVLANVTPKDLQKQIGMITQSSIDFSSLLRAVETSIGNLDVFPRPESTVLPLFNAEDYVSDEIADIDTSNISYVGTSMGCVLGATFVALAPELKGAFLQVPGVGIMHILADSFFWNFKFHSIMPEGSDGAEATALRAMIQQEMDYGDAINFVHYFRNPPAGIAAKPVGVMAGQGDYIVPNPTTVALAEIADIPLVGDKHFDIPGVAQLDDYDAEGYGITQIPLKNPEKPSDIATLMAHITFVSEAAVEDMTEWMQRFILDQEPSMAE